MKCTFCGGDVDAQMTKCPFCGKENPAGMAFQEQVEAKKKRNRELPRFILKLEEKEIKRKLLTRINIALVVLNVILLVGSFGLYLLSDIKTERVPKSGSIAEQFENEFYYNEEYRSGFYHADELVEYIVDFMEHFENGEEVKDYRLESIVEGTNRVVSDLLKADPKPDYAKQQRIEEIIRGFYQGYLGFTEEEMAPFGPDENGEKSTYLKQEEIDKLVGLMRQKMGEMKQ